MIGQWLENSRPFVRQQQQQFKKLERRCSRLKIIENTWQKHETTLLHNYALNEFSTADRSSKTQYF